MFNRVISSMFVDWIRAITSSTLTSRSRRKVFVDTMVRSGSLLQSMLRTVDSMEYGFKIVLVARDFSARSRAVSVVAQKNAAFLTSPFAGHPGSRVQVHPLGVLVGEHRQCSRHRAH